MGEVRDFNEKLHEHLLQEPNVKQPRYILKNLQYDSMHRLDLFTLPCAAAKLDASSRSLTTRRVFRVLTTRLRVTQSFASGSRLSALRNASRASSASISLSMLPTASR